MKTKHARRAAILLAASLATSAFADLTPYSQDFEGMTISDGAALSSDGWLVFGNVFDPGGNYLYGYGTFPAPNGTGAFSSVATGEGGPEQGVQYLNVFSDYNNGDHANGNTIESNVFQERVVGAGDLGTVYDFTFDYKASFTSGPGGNTTTFAFIKVLNPAAGFALVNFQTLETTTASTTDWVNGATITVNVDPGWENHILQFGFLSNATNYEPSGVYYDNVSFQLVPEPATLAALGVGALALMRRKPRR